MSVNEKAISLQYSCKQNWRNNQKAFKKLRTEKIGILICEEAETVADRLKMNIIRPTQSVKSNPSYKFRFITEMDGARMELDSLVPKVANSDKIEDEAEQDSLYLKLFSLISRPGVGPLILDYPQKCEMGMAMANLSFVPWIVSSPLKKQVMFMMVYSFLDSYLKSEMLYDQTPGMLFSYNVLRFFSDQDSLRRLVTELRNAALSRKSTSFIFKRKDGLTKTQDLLQAFRLYFVNRLEDVFPGYDNKQIPSVMLQDYKADLDDTRRFVIDEEKALLELVYMHEMLNIMLSH